MWGGALADDLQEGGQLVAIVQIGAQVLNRLSVPLEVRVHPPREGLALDADPVIVGTRLFRSAPRR